MQCTFFNPVTFNDETPTTTQDFFQFKNANCTTTQTELIVNDENGNSFYLDKTISYGDTLLVTMIFLFLVFRIIGFLTDWFIPKKLDWKQH